jgi:hypothetical protein
MFENWYNQHGFKSSLCRLYKLTLNFFLNSFKTVCHSRKFTRDSLCRRSKNKTDGRPKLLRHCYHSCHSTRLWDVELSCEWNRTSQQWPSSNISWGQCCLYIYIYIYIYTYIYIFHTFILEMIINKNTLKFQVGQPAEVEFREVSLENGNTLTITEGDTASVSLININYTLCNFKYTQLIRVFLIIITYQFYLQIYMRDVQ